MKFIKVLLAVLIFTIATSSVAEAGFSKKHLKRILRDTERGFKRGLQLSGYLFSLGESYKEEQRLKMDARLREAQAKRDAEIEKLVIEINNKEETIIFLKTSIDLQKSNVHGLEEVQSLSSQLLEIASTELANRTSLQEYLIRAKALVTDSQSDYISISNLLDNLLRQSKEKSRLLEEKISSKNKEGLTDDYVQSQVYLRTLKEVAKMRGGELESLMLEAVQTARRADLEALVQNQLHMQNEINDLLTNMRLQLEENERSLVSAERAKESLELAKIAREESKLSFPIQRDTVRPGCIIMIMTSPPKCMD